MELTEVQKEADSAGKKAIGFGVLALMFAVLFGWMLAQLNSGGPDTQLVVVAIEDIPPLTKLTEKQLKAIAWPAASMPKGAFDKVADVVTSNQINLNGLITGEPILKDRLSTPDRGLGMSQMVEPNMRAFVVQIQDSLAQAELIHPGAFVDVLATLTNPKNQDTSTHILLQNVQVMAVGDSIDVEAAKPRGDKGGSANDDRNRVERHRVVTLLVAVPDVEALTLATRQGKIDLALRSNNDSHVVVTGGMSMEQIMSDKHKAAAVQAQQEAAPVEAHSSMPPAARPAAKAPKQHHHEQDNGPNIYKVRH